jgi:hypothetical protein
MKQPLEFAYFQLLNGKMYPAQIEKKRLEPSVLPIIDTVTNQQTNGSIQPEVSKIDTVTPKFSIQDDED